MQYTDITQLIIVDEAVHSYGADLSKQSKGTPRQVTREQLYLNLAVKLQNRLPKLQYVNIIGDSGMGAFTVEHAETTPYCKCRQVSGWGLLHLSCSGASSNKITHSIVVDNIIRETIEKEPALLLVNYCPDTNGIDAGKKSALEVTLSVEVDNVIKLLYQLSSEGAEETPCPCIWGLPIGNPDEAVEKIMNHLKLITDGGSSNVSE